MHVQLNTFKSDYTEVYFSNIQENSLFLKVKIKDNLKDSIVLNKRKVRKFADKSAKLFTNTNSNAIFSTGTCH